MVRRHSRLPPDNPFPTYQPNHGGNWAFVVPYNDPPFDRREPEPRARRCVLRTQRRHDDARRLGRAASDCRWLSANRGYFFGAIQQAFELAATATPASLTT